MTADALTMVELTTDRVALTVDAAFGARVVQLTDLGSGRQWLHAGPRAKDSSEQADYLGDASRGWDECFPTVLPCDHAAWGGRLRDHGMLWGRAWHLLDAGPGHMTAAYTGADIVFTRALALEGARITADYTLRSDRDAPFPYLWSQHCVLCVTPEDRIQLTGAGQMDADGTSIDWPFHDGRDLSRIGARDEGFALKSYAMTPGPASASVSGPGGGLRIDWSGTEIPALGLWLNYGGWPAARPVHQIALEPTTGAADDLVAAEAIGQARWLEPGCTHRWSVRLTLLDPTEEDTP